MKITDKLVTELAQLRKKGLFRKQLLADQCSKKMNFSSNDYLSLCDEPVIQKAYAHGFSRYPTGSGASMTVCGYHPLHQTLEKQFSIHYNADRALLFSSGYAANLGVVQLLAKLGCHLLIDKSAHASIYDGINLANASYTRFLPNSLTDLESKLDHNQDFKVIITEGVFSMSGAVPNLNAISRFCNDSTACIVDEAHAFGVLGPQGLGAAASYALTQKDIPLRVIAFGKAMGCQGAIVVGQNIWIEGLYQFARSYIYSTAISPALTWGLLHTLEVLINAEERRQKLNDLVNYFQQKITHSPLKWATSSTPIQRLIIGCPYKSLAYGAELKKAGIICLPMRAPTVSVKSTGLRIVLNYHHGQEDIDFLFEQLHQIYDTLY